MLFTRADLIACSDAICLYIGLLCLVVGWVVCISLICGVICVGVCGCGLVIVGMSWLFACWMWLLVLVGRFFMVWFCFV